MGPSYDVPHMLLTFGEEAGGRYSLNADYVIRGSTPFGSDPSYMDAYYGQPVTDAWAQAHATGTTCAPLAEFESRMLHSPARISVTGLDAGTAQSLAEQHLSRFLSWLQTAEDIPARNRGSMNMRDDKLRQFFYRGQAKQSIAEFGEALGATVAAVNTGPTAEAYVGGGS